MKGQVLDTNSHFIARHLFAWGVKVMRVSWFGLNFKGANARFFNFKIGSKPS